MRKNLVRAVLIAALMMQTTSAVFAEDLVIWEEAESTETDLLLYEDETEADLRTEFVEPPEDETDSEDIWEDLFEEVPEVTEAGDDAEEAEEGIEEADEAEELEDALTVPENAAMAGTGTKRLLRAAINAAAFDGSFGNQLSGMAAELYQKRVDYYVNGRNTGALTITFNRNTSPIHFPVVLNSENKIDRTTTDYLDYHAQVKKAMQESGDAFLYDCSEIFWIRGGTYEMAPGKYKDSQTGEWVGYLAKIIYTPAVSFDGADALMSAYDAAVAQTAEQIRAGADCDGNGQADSLELAIAAHDYLCERLYYDNAALNRYNAYVAENGNSKAYGDLRIFVSAGAFLDSVGTGVVCEGYARAYKVLCDYYGIPCVLIGGKVVQGGVTIGHMWNGVQIDGKWYLTDVTWDDGGTKAAYRYFMVGNTLSGRTGSGNFSGSANTRTFVYPVLETEALDRYRKTDTIDPTCTEAGYSTYTNVIDASTQQRDFVDALGHDYSVTSSDATCTEPGHIKHLCTRCGDVYETEVVLGHAYEAVVIAPTCTAVGYTEYVCSRCNDSYRSDEKAALGHSFENGICTRCGIGDSITHMTISTISAQVYTGKAITPKLKAAFGSNVLEEGTDYTVTYRNNSVVGTAYATVTGKGNYTGTKTVSFKINKKSVTELNYSAISAQVYTGKAKKPAVTIKNGDVKLVKNQDYTISYTNNKAIGTATITIKGKGAYTGTKTLTFKINPQPVMWKKLKAVTGKKMTATWKAPETKAEANISGYQLQYATNSGFTGAKKVKAGTSALSKTITKLKKGKTYYVRIRTYKKVDGKTYYSTWSKTKKVKIK